jgi:hypothetical protein
MARALRDRRRPEREFFDGREGRGSNSRGLVEKAKSRFVLLDELELVVTGPKFDPSSNCQ